MSSLDFSLPEVFSVLIMYQSLFFAGNLFFTTAARSRFNLILGLLLFTIGLNFTNILLLSLELIPVRYNFGLCFGFLYGPLLHAYSRHIIQKNTTLDRAQSWGHYLPALLAFLLMLLGGAYPLVARRLEWITLLVGLHIIVYILLALQQIRRFQGRLKVNFSTIENKNLNWLRFLLVFFLLISLLALLEAWLPEAWRQRSGNIPLLIIQLFTLSAVNLIYFRGIRYPELFNEYVQRASLQKYADSGLTLKERFTHLMVIEAFMAKEKPYIDDDLSLQSLADRIGLSPRTLSEVINDQLKMNFYEFVNHYRVEEAKRLLIENSTEVMRINEVMYGAGFRSKSTFNSIFKKATGLTPKQFRDRY